MGTSLLVYLFVAHDVLHQALPELFLHPNQLGLLLGVLVEQHLHRRVLQPNLQQPHCLPLIGYGYHYHRGILLHFVGVVLGVAGVRHHIQIQRREVGVGQNLRFGLITYSRRRHKKRRGHRISFEEVLGSQTTDCCDLADADLVLTLLEVVERASVDDAHAYVLHDV